MATLDESVSDRGPIGQAVAARLKPKRADRPSDRAQNRPPRHREPSYTQLFCCVDRLLLDRLRQLT